MGQNQSLTAKGTLNLDNTSPSASQNCNQDHAPSPNPSASAGSGGGGNPTGSNAMELQTQSVRAAIDSFIETCLAGGPEKTSCTPHGPGTERTPPPASDAEVVRVPEDDDGGDKPGGGKDRGGDESSGNGKPEVAATGGLSSDKTGECSSEISMSSTNVPPDGNSSKDMKFAVDGSSVPDGRVASAQKTDEKSSTNETKTVLSVNPTKSSSTCVPDENLAHRSPICEGSKSKESSDASNDGEGVASVQLKTIIERVLDSSLGVGMSLKSIPLEQQILPQIAADETATSTSNKTKETESGKGREMESGKASSEGGWDRRVEPVTLCFMDHIEKAVERSFSSITEEEERKEKEKALAAAAKVADSKAPSWNNTRVSKNSDAPSPASSAADGTISVQDIVDRVISQTEVISKRGTDSKPLVAASGTFYPDRAPAQTNPQSQHRREAHKEESPRESMGRRGRPRMRSPYHDHREAAVQDYLHGNPARETMAVRRVPAGVPPEDYLQSMHAAMAKYGQVHPSHGMPPFLPAGMATTASVTQGYLPASTMHGAVVAAGGGSLHPSTAALHQAQAVRGAAAPHHTAAAAPHHTTAAAPHHTTAASSQPPPLLRVNPMERSERSPHQQKHPHPHPPSRSCGCSVCAVYFGRERDAERARMQQSGQGERSVPRSSPHSPHHPYSKSSVAVAQAHPQRWPNVDPRHTEPKAEKMHAHHPFPYPSQSALRGHDAYPAGHPAYGIQTGVPAPQLGYVEKPLPEPRHAQPPYPKAVERGGEYGHAYRPAHVGYDKAQLGEAVVGRQPYPPSVTSVKPLAGHPRPHPHAPTHTHAHMQSGRKAEDPGLDLTYRRDLATAATAAATTAVAPAFGVEEDKPLDLSAKKQASPAPFQERQDMHQRLEDHRVEDGRHYTGGVMNMDCHVREVTGPDRQRDGEKFVSGSQHLHNLETSVESYFQKLQQHPGVHRAPPPQNISAGVPPQHISMAVTPHAQGTGAGLPFQTMGAAVYPSSCPESAVPLPPHHPTHPAQHRNPAVHQGYPPASNPSPAYPPEPLLSPGGRRPQLHPIPAPNLSTSLGPTAPRPTAAFQSRGGGSTIPVAPGVPTHSVSSASNQSLPVPVSSPQTSGGGAPYSADYLRSSGSRSVSPPAGSDARGEDRRRGSVSKHEPIQNIIGNNNPQDILYLICRLCRQTYGSPYGFRKHFRNQHGFEPKAEHTFVQTISATKSARQLSGGGTPNMDSESPLQEPYLHPGNSPVDSIGHSSHTASPRPEMVRSIADESPRSRNSDSPGDPHSGEGGAVAAPAQGYKYRGSFSRASTDSKGRSPSGSASGGSVVDEREDTKCLECPECGQAFQLNDFGSYKRHCRQHGQMRGAQGGVSQGVYTCTDCQCSFSEHQLLQEHLVRHEAHTAAVLCTVCRVPFPSPAHCQEHVRTVHGGLSAEPTSSSSSPLLVTSKARSVSSAFSHSDISSTSSVKREIASTASADSSISFNLTVTTPSDLEIRRLPADHIVTSASPDSSSDNKKGQECSSVSSSEQTKTETVKTEPGSLDSPKPTPVEGSDSPKIKLESKAPVKTEEDKDSGYLDGCPSNDSRSISTEGSLASSVDMEENTELFMYKHKKFSAHRKRAGSSEGLEMDVKQPRLETDAGSWEKTQQNVVSSASDKGQAKKAAASPPAVSGEEKSLAPPKPAPSKTEARHQMPFVWDRVTRSQAGKNARSSDYS